MFIFRLVSRQIYHFSSSLNCICYEMGFLTGEGILLLWNIVFNYF